MKQTLLAWIRAKLGITALEIALKQEQARVSKIDLHVATERNRLRVNLERLERREGVLRVLAHLPPQVKNPRGQLFGGFTPTYVDFMAIHTFWAGREPRLKGAAPAPPRCATRSATPQMRTAEVWCSISLRPCPLPARRSGTVSPAS